MFVFRSDSLVALRKGSVVALAAVWIVGCGPSHKAMAPDLHPEIRSARVVSVVPQDQIEIRVEMSEAGSMFGLVGALVDVAVTSSRQNKADDRLFVLQAACAEFDARAMYWEELGSVLDACHWPARTHLLTETDASVSTNTAIRKLVFEMMEDSALILESGYFLSPKANVLTVKTSAQFFRREQVKPDYFGTFTYYSDEVGSVDDEAAIALWAEQGAERFVDEMLNGIESTMEMLRIDLLDHMDQLPQPELADAKFEYESPETGDKVKWRGQVLSEGERLLVRREDGNLYSLPTAFLKDASSILATRKAPSN